MVNCLEWWSKVSDDDDWFDEDEVDWRDKVNWDEEEWGDDEWADFDDDW